jgi:hypothetical protein
MTKSVTIENKDYINRPKQPVARGGGGGGLTVTVG